MQLSQLSTIHLFWKDNDRLSWLPSYWRCLLRDRERPNKLQQWCIYVFWTQGGAPVQATRFWSSLCPYATLRGQHISPAGMNLTWLSMPPAMGKYKHIYSSVIDTDVLCAVCVYWLLVLCVLFSPAAASLAPTEQLVLTTIRQEASEPQDPGEGTGATMRC